MSAPTLSAEVVGGPPDDDVPRAVAARPTASDRVFRTAVRAAALNVLVVMGLIGLFLVLQSTDALRVAGWSFLTQQEWLPEAGRFGISELLLGTVLIAAVALVVAVPLAFGAAVFITEYAPVRLRPVLVSVVDLMAAVPSIVYGLWGFFFLQPRMVPFGRWLADHLGWIPLFAVHDAEAESAYASSTLIAGVAVSLVVIPIVCSLMREVFAQAPIGEREAAVALGATRWGVIRTVVLPFGRGGMIGATMLGLGRALGETVIVYLIISPIFVRRTRIVESGGNSIAAHIAIRFPDSTRFDISALMAAGLALFLLTLVVNTIAAAVVARSRSGAQTEI